MKKIDLFIKALLKTKMLFHINIYINIDTLKLKIFFLICDILHILLIYSSNVDIQSYI